MQRDVILDIAALRRTADGSTTIERHLVLRYVETAERCLGQLHGIVVHGNHRAWKSAVHELRAASLAIHARQLATLCKYAGDCIDDAVTRMGVYLRIKEAHEALLRDARKANLLTPHGTSNGGS